MQNDYRVEKTRVPVTLLTLAGQRVTGDVYLQPYTQLRRGREEVIDLLNGGDPYIPVRGDDGTIRFVAKDRVLHAELDELPAEHDARRLGAREAVVEITLANGCVFTGCILYEVPSARPRLLDYLNRLDQRFVVVHTGNGPRLVNRLLIDVLRPLD